MHFRVQNGGYFRMLENPDIFFFFLGGGGGGER